MEKFIAQEDIKQFIENAPKPETLDGDYTTVVEIKVHYAKPMSRAEYLARDGEVLSEGESDDPGVYLERADGSGLGQWMTKEFFDKNATA